MPAVFVESCRLPNPFGDFRLHGFEDTDTGLEHIALTLGDVPPPVKGAAAEPILCRVHSECLTGDCLYSMRCDCGSQLEYAMKEIAARGRGILFYLRQEGRGIGLINKIRAYKLQDAGADTVEANERLGFDADLRDYTVCKPMFRHLQVSRIELMTNNPLKVQALSKLGMDIVRRIPIKAGHNDHNALYLATKADKLGHLLKPSD